MRWTIEQLFQEGKGYLGLDYYETLSYPSWHRHITLVASTMHFSPGNAPEVRGDLITLPIAQKLFVAALIQNLKFIQQAIKIVIYYLGKVEVARLAHRKKALWELETL